MGHQVEGHAVLLYCQAVQPAAFDRERPLQGQELAAPQQRKTLALQESPTMQRQAVPTNRQRV